MKNCDICNRILGGALVSTRDFGGTCLACMAQAGDPAAIDAIIEEYELVNGLWQTLETRVDRVERTLDALFAFYTGPDDPEKTIGAILRARKEWMKEMTFLEGE